MGRPIIWNIDKKNEAITLILDRIYHGESVRSILVDSNKDKDALPSRKLFNEWLNDTDGLSDQYVRACNSRADAIFDEIIEIADDKSQDEMVTDKGFVVMNSEFVARSRLKIDARKWIASKLNPKKYGEKMDVTSAGEKIPVINFQIVLDDSDKTIEETD
jgi:hypothetical protein